MEIRQLEMLMAVVERKGYLHAGRYLHVSHSAIHRQIRLLEEELGERVFVKTGRIVRLTETGKLLIALAAKVRQEVAAVERQIKDRRELVSGELRIGTGTTSLIFFLPPILEKFRKAHPGVELYIITGTAEQLIPKLQNGNLDLGLISEPIDGWPVEKDLCYQRLYAEEFTLAVSKKHRLANQKKIPWSDLKDTPIIAFPHSSRIRHLIDARFREAHVAPKVIMELENEEAIETMINISFGAGFIAKRRIGRNGLHTLSVGEKPILLNVAAVHGQSYAPLVVREFLRMCKF